MPNCATAGLRTHLSTEEEVRACDKRKHDEDDHPQPVYLQVRLRAYLASVRARVCVRARACTRARTRARACVRVHARACECTGACVRYHVTTEDANEHLQQWPHLPVE